MSKKILLVIIFTFSFYLSIGQKELIREYYKLVNNAEIEIIKSNYKECLHYYNNAFKRKFPNDKDLFNAFVVSYFSGDTVEAVNYFNLLAYMGLEKKSFPDSLINPPFYKYISLKYDSCRKAGQNSQMPLYAAELIKIKDQDQKVRKEGLDNPQLFNNNEFKQKLIQSDSLNIVNIQKYILKNGFPSFEQKGFWDGTSPNNPNAIFWVVFHKRPHKTNIDSIIYQGVLDGKFRPDDWAAILYYRLSEMPDDYCIKFWNDDLGKKKFNSNCNQLRTSIYLESLEDYEIKWRIAREQQEKKANNYKSKITPKQNNILSCVYFYNFFLLPTTSEIKLGF